MFGMVLTDSPRNHNWTAFRDLDDCMKNDRKFNYKPDRREEFHDAPSAVSSEGILGKMQTAFIQSCILSSLIE